DDDAGRLRPTRLISACQAATLDARRRRSIASCHRKEGAHEALEVCRPGALPPPARRLAGTGFPRRRLCGWDARRRRPVRECSGFPRRLQPGLPRLRLHGRPSGRLPRGPPSLPRGVRTLPCPFRVRLSVPPRLPSSVGVLLRLRAPLLFSVLPDRRRQPALLLPAFRFPRELPFLLLPVRRGLPQPGRVLRPHPPLPSLPRGPAALPRRARLARRLRRRVGRPTLIACSSSRLRP